MSEEISLRLMLPKTVFAPAEPVKMTLEAVNTTGTEMVLQFSSSQQFDFVVLDDQKKEIWRWSHGRTFAMMLTRIILAPGEVRSFGAVWKQVDNDAQPVPSGDYLIQGFLKVRVSPESVSQTVHIGMDACV